MKLHLLKPLTLGVLLSTSIYAVDCDQTYKVQSFAQRFYVEVLERQPDNAGLDGWTNDLTSRRKTGTDVANGFIFSEEFVAKDKTNEEFVTIMYRAFFNRPAAEDAEGTAYWLEKLNNGEGKEAVSHGFLYSQEFANLSAAYGIQAYEGASFTTTALNNFVKRFYSVILGRDADSAGLKNWTDKLSTNEATGSDIAFGFILSTEYDMASKTDTEYLNTLYSAFFNRAADEAGFNGWMTQLNGGTTKEEVLEGFLHSQEFINLTNSFGILAFEGAPTADPSNNVAPTAHAGVDQRINFTSPVTLDASSSTDSDGSIECGWWIEDGTVLSRDESFTKSDFAIGEHSIRLTVVDDKGASNSDSVLIDIQIFDTDGDGIPDVDDADINGDGIIDNGLDTDGDGINDAADPDDDGDGILDGDDPDPLDPKTIAFKGLTYKIITSDDTGREWLDRNLGATKVCDKSRDDTTAPYADDDAYVVDQQDCFGDYYQWGRKTNGHEKKESTTSTTLLVEDVDSGGTFIKTSAESWEKASTWRETPNDVLWSGIDALNVICPAGFSVPTASELLDDTKDAIGENEVTNRDTAFINFLHLPIAGTRDHTTGEIHFAGDMGYISTNDTYEHAAVHVLYWESNAMGSVESHEEGLPVRCIKNRDTVDTTSPTVTNNPQIPGSPFMLMYTWPKVDTNITLSFSEAMDRTTLVESNFHLYKKGTNTALTFNIVETGRRVIIDPDIDLKYNTEYIIAVSTDVKDTSGNLIEENGDDNVTGQPSFNLHSHTTNSLSFNGKTYSVITSPDTGLHWLDRNLGASMVCSKSRDDAAFADDNAYVTDQENCFGDYYQWGRRTNGHEKKNSEESPFTINHDVDSGGKFIMVNADPYDWRTNQYRFLWTSINRDKICPSGFVVPRIGLLTNELTGVSNRDDAFNSFLKIPTSGLRNEGGNLDYMGRFGYLWSATDSGEKAKAYLFSSTLILIGDIRRAIGAPVRCIEK